MATVFNINNQQIDGVQKAPFWIANGLDKEAILYAEKFGQELTKPDGNEKQKLSTSQIRNVYGDVQKMKMKGFDEQEFLLLKPRLAYTTLRSSNKTEGSKQFKQVIEKALEAVLEGKDQNEKSIRFQNFANFFEAILAYHRSFGGK